MLELKLIVRGETRARVAQALPTVGQEIIGGATEAVGVSKGQAPYEFVLNGRAAKSDDIDLTGIAIRKDFVEVTPEGLAQLPPFVVAQMQSYMVRSASVWLLQEMTVGPRDFDVPLFRTEGYFSYLPRGSHFWVEQNPIRLAFTPARAVALEDKQEMAALLRWNHCDAWVISWDTDASDTIDELIVIALKIQPEE